MVVLRLRGRTTLGATAFIVLADYAERLRAAGGHLFLSGVEPDLLDQLRRSHRVDLRDAVTVVPASDTILESTQQAYEERKRGSPPTHLAWTNRRVPSGQSARRIADGSIAETQQSRPDLEQLDRRIDS